MCFDLTQALVATAARAAATGLVSMSTRPDPEGSGTVEIATRRCPRLPVVWDLRELTPEQNPRPWSLPARLGPVAAHPTRWGVGPQTDVLPGLIACTVDHSSQDPRCAQKTIYYTIFVNHIRS